MATDGPYQTNQVVAVDDWSTSAALHKFVAHDGTFAADATKVAGVLKSHAKAGQLARVAFEGIVKAYAGAAVTSAGCALTVTTSGFLAVGSYGTTAVCRLTAQSAPCASGDLVTVQLGGVL